MGLIHIQKHQKKRNHIGKARHGIGNKAAYLFLLPSLTGVLVLFVVPYLDVIRRSFMDGTGNKSIGLENYTTVLSNRAFRLATVNTACFIAVCVPLLILLSLLIAVYLQENKYIGKWIKSAFLLPMAMPVASIVLLWNVLFTKNGFISGFLQLFGIAGQNWLNTKFSFGILVFSYIWKNLGYDIILWLAALSTIPPEIYEAAKIDGASARDSFFTLQCRIFGLRYFSLQHYL